MPDVVLEVFQPYTPLGLFLGSLTVHVCLYIVHISTCFSCLFKHFFTFCFLKFFKKKYVCFLYQNLKERCWNKAAHFFDLPDFLSWKATGSLTRWALFNRDHRVWVRRGNSQKCVLSWTNCFWYCGLQLLFMWHHAVLYIHYVLDLLWNMLQCYPAMSQIFMYSGL